MTEDRILRELGRQAREDGDGAGARLDERWERLAAGRLTAQEEAELRALAETSAEARDAYEAFRPLGAAFEAQVVDAVAAELARRPAPAAIRPAAEPPPPFQRPPARRWTWLSAAGAAAAVLASLWLFLPSAAPLPDYVAAGLSGNRQFRGGGDAVGVPVFTPGTTLKLRAKPQSSASGPLEAHAYLSRGTELRPWEPKGGSRLETSESGVVSLEGTVGDDLPLPATGEWRLWIVIARRREFPSLDELRAKLIGTPNEVMRGRRWVAVSKPVDFRDRPAR